MSAWCIKVTHITSVIFVIFFNTDSFEILKLKLQGKIFSFFLKQTVLQRSNQAREVARVGEAREFTKPPPFVQICSASMVYPSQGPSFSWKTGATTYYVFVNILLQRCDCAGCCRLYLLEKNASKAFLGSVFIFCSFNSFPSSSVLCSFFCAESEFQFPRCEPAPLVCAIFRFYFWNRANINFPGNCNSYFQHCVCFFFVHTYSPRCNTDSIFGHERKPKMTKTYREKKHHSHHSHPADWE